MAIGTFATAINCIDGRVQRPVSDWVKINCHVDYVDTITEPGVDRLLALGTAATVDAVRRKVLVSLDAHHSGVIAVVGHAECAGNPVSDEEHAQHIRQAVEVIAAWGLPMRVIGLWVTSSWLVEVVCEAGQGAG